MNRIEIANELCILGIMYMINILINPVITPFFRGYSGHMICLIAIFNIVGNLMLTMYYGKQEAMKSWRESGERKKFNDRINLKIENRKKMVKCAHG